MTTELDLTPEQRETVGRAALDWVLRWFDRTTERRLYPDVTAEGLEGTLRGAFPDEPQDPLDVLRTFTCDIAPGARDNGHPRMFGYVVSSGAYVGAVADFLSSALNQNVTSWRSAPSGTTIERQVVSWIRDIVGFGPEGEGLLVGGGSMANFVGLAAALSAVAPEVGRRGVRAVSGDPVVYASDLVHMSIPRAAAMLGLGRDAVRRIPVDSECRIQLAVLDEAIREDRRAGRLPVCVVVNAGDVNTGAVDPLEAARPICAGDSASGCTRMAHMAASRCWRRPAAACSRASGVQTPSRSTLTSGSTCRWTPAVSWCATPSRCGTPSACQRATWT